jgi:hypothetical protein
VVQGIPMTEIQPRHYRGTYNVLGTRDVGDLLVVGRFRDKNGDLSVKNAITPVEIVGRRSNDVATIDSPSDGDRVDSPITIRGTADPRDTVQVRIQAVGTQYYILPYQQNLGTFNLQVNNNGKWRTDPIDLPHPKNVTGLKYIITVIQADSDGRTSPTATITVQAR